MIRRANAHKGASLLEIYQNCHIFNDGAFDVFTERATRKDNSIFVSHGQPLVFGENEALGIRLDGNKPQVVTLNDGFSKNDLWIHDENDLWKAQTIVRFFEQNSTENKLPRPFGVLYASERPCYETIVNQQVSNAKVNPHALLSGKDSWTIRP
jgi:2-oxoglutarate ferredoxin oxidoreductase subunit beta